VCSHPVDLYFTSAKYLPGPFQGLVCLCFTLVKKSNLIIFDIFSSLAD
jgi:hypothetical protein